MLAVETQYPSIQLFIFINLVDLYSCPMMWNGLNWLWRGLMVGFCEHGNESSDLIKAENFLTS